MAEKSQKVAANNRGGCSYALPQIIAFVFGGIAVGIGIWSQGLDLEFVQINIFEKDGQEVQVVGGEKDIDGKRDSGVLGASAGSGGGL